VDNKPTKSGRGGGGPGGGGPGGRRFGTANRVVAARRERERHERERGEPTAGSAAAGGPGARGGAGGPAPGRGGFGAGGRGGGGRGGFGGRGGGGGAGFWGGLGDGERHAPSLTLRPEWPVVEQFAFSALAKLSHKPPPGVDIALCGSLAQYDKAFDRVTPRTGVALRPSRRAAPPPAAAATSADPILLAEASRLAPGAKAVFITDSLLAALMAAPRSVYGWDLVLTRKGGGQLWVDKRPGALVDAPTVAETSPDAPVMAPPPADGAAPVPGTAAALAAESAGAERAWVSQALVGDGTGKKTLPDQLPAWAAGSGEAGAPPPPATGYRYRKFALGGGAITLFVRCAVDAVAPNPRAGLVTEEEAGGGGGHGRAAPAVEAPPPALGGALLVALHALTEYDPKAASSLSWRAKLEAQRGAVLATELKNNAPKLARWAAAAAVAGADVLKIGLVSRAHPKDPGAHTLLGVHSVKPKDFAAQIALSMECCWGIAHAVTDLALRLGEGTYLLVKDAAKPVARLYSLPEGVDALGGEI